MEHKEVHLDVLEVLKDEDKDYDQRHDAYDEGRPGSAESRLTLAWKRTRGFWIGLGLWFLLVAPHAPSPAAVQHDLGWILLSFAIFNFYMLIASTQVNAAVFGVFLLLEITEILLVIGNLRVAHGHPAGWVHWGGWFGIATAAIAWYTSAAGVVNGMSGKTVVPVGKPFWT